MKTQLCLFLAFLVVSTSGFAANPRVLKNAGDGIKLARDSKTPLILFALLDATEGSRNFATLLNNNKLKMEGREFVVVLCDASDPRNKTLFEKTFAQAPKALPSVLIADPKGKQMAPALNGVQVQDDYDRMIHAALVEAGLRKKDAPIISSTTGEVLEGSSDIFRIMKEDIQSGPVVMTKYRDWTLKNGEKFHGALLKAEGANGIFRLESGGDKNIDFIDLIPEDIEFIQKALSE